MRYRRFEPLERDLSVLVLGTAVYEFAPLDAALDLLDAYAEAGGNVLDTARRYGNAEPIVGRWLRERGGDVVLAGKGAHFDDETQRRRVTPEDLSADLEASLTQLGVETIDLYSLHRDDPSQPVGPLLETLNRHARRGRIRRLGTSNWTTERLDEARAYAEEHGLEGFCASSVGLSLARPKEDPYWETVTLDDPSALDWYERVQLPVFAWSAQACGFFACVSSEHVERVYDDERNRERRRRAEELGRRAGATATQVALAWVLDQAFPTYAIIGPRRVEELHESLGALDLELTREDARWLDLEEE